MNYKEHCMDITVACVPLNMCSDVKYVGIICCWSEPKSVTQRLKLCRAFNSLCASIWELYLSCCVENIKVKHARYCTVSISVNVEVDWGNAHHKMHIRKHNEQNEINCVMMKPY